MAFLVGGGAATVVTIGCAVLGGLCGIVRRRGGGAGTIALVAAGLAPIAAAGAVAVLFVFAAARDLAFASLRATASGVLQVAAQLGLPTSLTDGVLRLVDTLLAFWPAVVAVVVAVAVVVGMLATHLVVSAVSRRVEWLADDDPLDDATRREEASVAPLPLVFEGVGYRHPGAAQQAVSDLDLHIEPGEFVAVVGPNGTGKSTLVALLAGARAESGRVRRPGAVGLGRPGGTFVLAQRADSQVIASTVAEELRWGLPPEVSVDVEALLGDVGLHGLASAGTDTLSGGQLQRLAIAGALARRPALLISDESTSMLDAEGRRDVLDLLAALPARTGTAVVHVTHDPAEAARAHRVIGMRGGRLVDADASGGPVPSEPPLTIGPSAESDAPVVLRLRGVGHRFDAGTPWEVPALHDIDLDVREGEGVVITGGNGSGKSTLAWVMAGLLRPTSGAALVDDVPAADAVGAVALSFQHARLQLQRPTVAEDILAASGRADEEGDDVVRSALLRVGLSEELADRSIDHLSGGQMRRVAIAGLLAAGRRVLVLDEPLAGLDRESRRSLLALLGHLRRTDGLTLVVVSHDLEEMGIACDRVVTMSAGTIVDGGEADEATGESSILRPVDAEAARRRRPRRTGIVLRAVPGMSPLHRLDPVAKLTILAVSTVLAIAIPGWVTIGLLAALVIVGTTMARLPSSVVPRLPWWVVALLIVSGAAAAIGGGWVPYVQSILLSLLFFALSLLVIWTTPVELLPSAFLRMTRPLRVLRAPVDEWAHTLAIVVRSLPLMREETRTLLAARRLRRHVRPHGVWARLRAIVGETLDLVIAVLASAGRRSVDLGRAMTRRGGMPSLTARR